MKTLIQSLACVSCLSLGFATVALSADAPSETKMSKEAKQAADSNHITVKDGKVWVMKDGTKLEMTGPVTLLDGTTVMPDGSFTMANSNQKQMLKEGEAITWAGKVKDHDKLMKDIEQQKLQDETQRANSRN